MSCHLCVPEQVTNFSVSFFLSGKSKYYLFSFQQDLKETPFIEVCSMVPSMWFPSPKVNTSDITFMHLSRPHSRSSHEYDMVFVILVPSAKLLTISSIRSTIWKKENTGIFLNGQLHSNRIVLSWDIPMPLKRCFTENTKRWQDWSERVYVIIHKFRLLSSTRTRQVHVFHLWKCWD